MHIYIIGAVICLVLLLQLSERYAKSSGRTDSYWISFVCVLMALFWPVVIPTIFGAFLLMPSDPKD